MEMKKYISTLLLIFVFILPLNLHAKKLSVKLTFGLTSGGHIVRDNFIYPVEYECVALGQALRSKIGMDIYLEFVYQLSPHFSLSLGNGYSSRMLRGKTPQFTPAEGSPYVYDYVFLPEINSQMVPICLSARYSYIASPSFQANIKGGIGYYYGIFQSESKFHRSIPGLEPVEPEFRPANFTANGLAFGFHLGTGLDVSLSEHFVFVIEGLYTVVKFKKIESSAKLEEIQLFFSKVIFNTDTNTLEFFDYSVSEFDLTGFSLRAGLKFTF